MLRGAAGYIDGGAQAVRGYRVDEDHIGGTPSGEQVDREAEEIN